MKRGSQDKFAYSPKQFVRKLRQVVSCPAMSPRGIKKGDKSLVNEKL